MSHIVVTKSGNVLESAYNDNSEKYSKFSRNLTTNFYVGLLEDESCVYTNMLDLDKYDFKFEEFDTISTNTVLSNADLYNELKALL